MAGLLHGVETSNEVIEVGRGRDRGFWPPALQAPAAGTAQRATAACQPFCQQLPLMLAGGVVLADACASCGASCKL